MKRLNPPDHIGDCIVYPSGGDPLTTPGHIWITLIPKDNEDTRLWEFCLLTGKIIQTVS